MKKEASIKAAQMRKEGLSINEIASQLQVAKSSVSLWVRSIRLKLGQIKALEHKYKGFEAIEKRRSSRLHNEEAKRQLVIDAAVAQVKPLTDRELFISGVMLYWA